MPHPTQLSKWAVLSVALLITVYVTPANAAWRVDSTHTSVNFSVKHFFTPVSGSFREFDIQLDYDPDNPSGGTVEVTIPVASLDTANERRDGHLRTADFFEVDTYPTITFKSSSVRADGSGGLIATGPLTIKDVSKEVDLTISVLGVKEIPEQMQQMMGAKRVAGFTASTTIDRGDFGVGTGNWAASAVIGDEVEISIQLEAHAD